MNVHYRVLSTDPTNKRILVRYWSDVATENVLATSKDVNGDVMLTSNGWPIRTSCDYSVDMFITDANASIENITNMIEHYAPVGILAEIERRMQNTTVANANFDLVNSIANQEYVFTYTTTPINRFSPQANVESRNYVVNTFIEYMQNNYNITITPK